MRKLIWFTLGVGTACGISAYFFTPKALVIPLFLLAAVGMVFCRSRPNLKRFAIMLMGISAGIIWFSGFQTYYLNPLYTLDGLTQDAEIRCSSYGEKTDYGCRTEARVEIQGRGYPVMVYLDEGLVPEPGTTLSGSFCFQVTAPGGQKESGYYQGEGIFLLAYQNEELTVSVSERNRSDIPAVLRQKFLDLLEASLPEDAMSFAQALMFGDSTGLGYPTLTNLSVSGIRHIVAVSGLHVSILFGLLGMVTFRKRFLFAVIGIPVLVLFAAMTGFTPSVCRACMMSGLMLLAMLANREYDGPTALAFSGLVLLLVNPFVITSVSYQLSFASVAGIFSCTPAIRKWLLSVWKVPKGSKIGAKVIHGIILCVSVTLGATVATVPLCAVYFGTVSLAAIVTNLLVLWIVSVIFYGLLLICLMGIVWPEFAVLLGKIVTVMIRYVMLIAGRIAAFPLASVYTRSFYIILWLFFAYLLLAVFLLSSHKKPILFGCCVTIGLCCALLASWVEGAFDDVRLTVLDVGQGQCILFQSEGRTYMVDCGGTTDAMAADAAAETLLSQGISRLDGFILTHYDSDHAGGLENLLCRIDAELLILPAVYSDINLEAEQILYASQDLNIRSDHVNIDIYSSGKDGSGNENSLCILFDTENCDILITGDRSGFGERMLLRRMGARDVDVLVAGHHGSKDSTSEELLAAVMPEIVCISVGEGNRYGHPAPELLQRLEDYGCAVYRTDIHGDITIRR